MHVPSNCIQHPSHEQQPSPQTCFRCLPGSEKQQKVEGCQAPVMAEALIGFDSFAFDLPDQNGTGIILTTTQCPIWKQRGEILKGKGVEVMGLNHWYMHHVGHKNSLVY